VVVVGVVDECRGGFCVAKACLCCECAISTSENSDSAASGYLFSARAFY